MNKYVSEIIDKYYLHKLHKKRSIISQFQKNITVPPALDDLNSFYHAPSTPNIIFDQKNISGNYRIGKYKYESDIKSNEESNNYSTGYSYKNTDKKQSVSVILVHGWRMDSFDRINNIYLKPFMDLEYNIYTFTLPHHFDRTSDTSLYNGEFFVSANVDRTLLSIKQSVSDLRALISYIKANNEKVILIGVSLGGFITNLLGVIEKEIDILISVMYANSMAFSIYKSIPGKYMKEDFESHSFTYDELEKYWAIIIPSNFKPVIPKENILLISGIYDKYVLGEDTDLFWKSWDTPQRLLYPCGHAGIVLSRKKIARDSLSFIEKRI